MSMRNADIIIVGGGLVGLSFALALKDLDYSVIIIDRQVPRFQFSDTSIDLRVSAISAASQQFFDELGIWSTLMAQRVGQYQQMQVWDSQTSGHIAFDALDVGQPYLGHIVENRRMHQALFQGVHAAGHCQQVYSHDTLCLSRHGHEWCVYNDVLGEIRAPLLIGADGARSWVREVCQFELSQKAYAQHAVVASVQVEKAHQHTAYQRFLPTGPLAFLPLWDQQLCSIVWSTTPEMAQSLLNMPDQAFNARLSHAFAERLGKTTVLGQRAAFPLTRQHVKTYVKAGVALIGDAAHTIHPLAGQGVNLGFQDAKALAKVIKKQQEKQRSLDALSALKSYERERYAHNALTMRLMDGFNGLFSNNTPSLKIMRAAGLTLTNRLAPIKQLMIKQAMGG